MDKRHGFCTVTRIDKSDSQLTIKDKCTVDAACFRKLGHEGDCNPKTIAYEGHKGVQFTLKDWAGKAIAAIGAHPLCPECGKPCDTPAAVESSDWGVFCCQTDYDKYKSRMDLAEKAVMRVDPERFWKKPKGLVSSVTLETDRRERMLSDLKDLGLIDTAQYVKLREMAAEEQRGWIAEHWQNEMDECKARIDAAFKECEEKGIGKTLAEALSEWLPEKMGPGALFGINREEPPKRLTDYVFTTSEHDMDDDCPCSCEHDDPEEACTLERELFHTDPEVVVYVRQQMDIGEVKTAEQWGADRSERYEMGLSIAYVRAAKGLEPEATWLRRAMKRMRDIMDRR